MSAKTFAVHLDFLGQPACFPTRPFPITRDRAQVTCRRCKRLARQYAHLSLKTPRSRRPGNGGARPHPKRA